MSDSKHVKRRLDLTWVQIRPNEPGCRMWGAFDGSTFYSVVNPVFYGPDETLFFGFYALSVKQWSSITEIGRYESFEQAKERAENDRMGRIH